MLILYIHRHCITVYILKLCNPCFLLLVLKIQYYFFNLKKFIVTWQTNVSLPSFMCTTQRLGKLVMNCGKCQWWLGSQGAGTVVTWPRRSQSAGCGQLGASSSFPLALTLKTEEVIQLCRTSGWLCRTSYSVM